MLALLLLGGGMVVLALLWRSPRVTHPVTTPSPSPTQTAARDNPISLELQPGVLQNEGLKKLSLRDYRLSFFRLKLSLPQRPSYAVWRIIVTTAEGTEIARASGSLEQDQRQHNYVTASLPTGTLTAGDYLVILQGQTSSESFRTVATYAFRLTP
jgi:hypothetical protein